MNLTWYGHAAFLLEGTNEEGKIVRVVLDPYQSPQVGTYAPIDDVADVVAISHINEKYHSFIDTVHDRNGNTPIIIDGLQLLDRQQPERVCDIPFTAVRVWENEERLEPIAMVGLTVGGLRVLHMGDCGHALSPDDVAASGSVDVLLALAGSFPTISLPDLVEFIQKLRPRVVIPMHFKNEKINLPLQPVSEFLAILPTEITVRHLDAPTIELTPDTLPTTTEVWVLPPAR